METGYVWLALIVVTMMSIALINCVLRLTKRYNRDQEMIARLESKVVHYNSIIMELREIVSESIELDDILKEKGNEKIVTDDNPLRLGRGRIRR